MISTNKNDNPLTSIQDLANETDYSSFSFNNQFQHICDLRPNITEEKIDIINNQKVCDLNKGLVYVLVINNKVFVIGNSINGIEERVGSYNLGTQANRRAGTCSTTNYFILQSLLNIGQNISVYAHYVKDVPFSFSSVSLKTSPTKEIKKYILSQITKPIGNTQN